MKLSRLISPFWAVMIGASALTLGLTLLLARGLSLETTHPALSALILVLFAVNTLMLAFAALISLLGLKPARTPAVKAAKPGKCAALWLVCGEPPDALAERVARFLQDVDATGQSADCDVFILSDTQTPAARAHEQRALQPLMHRITYRNRPSPKGRKPGNIQDWMARWGSAYDTMLMLDADSGFSARRLGAMRARMAADPELGLLQAAIRLRPGAGRFLAMQRLSSRLSGPVFTRGLARLSADAGNFWGHNALIRVAAFASVTPLPVLPGRAPFGGPVLSHDFVEAALLRAKRWRVEICPDSRGSFEDAPETISAHLRRDRRWAQGNLQHLRLLRARGLHPTSRFHLASGILSYLSAPIWLALVLLTGSGAVHATVGAIWPLLAVLALLLVPKLAGVLAQRRALASPKRRGVVLRALGAELGMTTLFAPLGMVRRSSFVVGILAGRSAGWVPSGQSMASPGAAGRAEMLGGFALILAVATPQAAIAGTAPAVLAALLVLPVAGPLLAAPLLWRWFEAEVDDTRHPVTSDPAQHAAAKLRSRAIATAAENALGAPPARVTGLGGDIRALFELAKRWPEAHVTGASLNADEVEIARDQVRTERFEARCQILRSDPRLPMTLTRADLVIACAPPSGRYITAAKRHLRPGGVLLFEVSDGMLAPDAVEKLERSLKAAGLIVERTPDLPMPGWRRRVMRLFVPGASLRLMRSLIRSDGPSQPRYLVLRHAQPDTSPLAQEAVA